LNDTPLLVMGTADWNQPIATNQHYLVRELARDHGVLYSESIGLRRPTLSPADLKRIARRLRPSTTPGDLGRAIPPNVTVTAPRVIPIHARATYYINQRLLESAVMPWIATPQPKILWTYNPVTYGLEAHASSTVYHCVDLLGEVVGVDKGLVDSAERSLARQGVKAIGSSRVVVRHLTEIGFEDVEYWPNVADISTINDERPKAPGRLRRAIFAGRITIEKIDYHMLQSVLDAGVPLAIAGPIGSDQDQVAVDKLVASGADYLGHLDFRPLAREYWKSQVGLIPYPVNKYTAGVNPLKLFEYLAAGLSVVGTPLPEMREEPTSGVTIRENVRDFGEATAAAIDAFDEIDAHARMEIARRHSWEGRGESARKLLQKVLGSARSR
jgi:teichuronic acid biosynthesis glycosyltransferase TuaH